MIYDCFLFFDEIELLEVRLNELEGIIDKFVLVESPITFSGKAKPLYFEEKKDRFIKFAGKINHIVVENSSECDPWSREFIQRNSILLGLNTCKENDIILISDVDEIPKAETIQKNINNPGFKVFKQKFFFYWLNCLCPDDWFGTRMASYKEVVELTPQKIRLRKGIVVEDGGWHFSYMGGIERIQNKIKSFAHTELDVPLINNTENILSALTNGKCFYNWHQEPFKFIGIDDSYPDFILKHRELFYQWIKRGWRNPGFKFRNAF